MKEDHSALVSELVRIIAKYKTSFMYNKGTQTLKVLNNSDYGYVEYKGVPDETE
jgi:hypothetical protein